MKKFTLLLALFAMFFLHVGSAKGATVTLSYAGGTTTNMTGNNDAALVGLDASQWSVIGDKGSTNNNVGLNSGGDIRLYAHSGTGNGNTLTVSISEGTIDEITLDIKANATYEVKAAGKVVAATNETTYTIGASSFSIQNTTKDTSTQLKLNGITITYTSTGDNGNDTPDDGGDDVTPDDGGNTTPDDGGDDVTPDDGGNTTPDDGGDDVTPDDGGNTTPDDGGDDVTPDDGGDDVTPDDGGDDVTPDDGGNDTPEDGDDDDTPLTSSAATMAAGENASLCTVNGADGVKVGTSKKVGQMTITVPAGAKTLSFYAAAWNKVSGLSLEITPAANITPASIELTADAGINNESPFTLQGEESSYLFEFKLKDITKSTTFTLTAPKRFVVWNATYSADGTAGDDTPDDGGTTPDTPKGDEVKVSGLVYADAIYYEYEGASYYDIDMYKDMDSETYEYTYPEVYVSIPAKSKTALNGTYDVLYAGYWSSANDSVEIDEETYGTITIKNTDNEGNYSVQGSFVGTDGKTYTFNEVVNVWAFDYDTFEEIVLNETGGTDTPDTPGTDNPVAGTVTFDADVDKGNAGTDSNNATAYQVSKDGVTMEVSSGILGTYNNELHYRIYKNQTLTITSTVGNIVSVEFTCTANDDEKFGPGCWTVDSGDYDYAGAVGTWTGSAASVTFTATANQVRTSQIVVKLGGTAVEDVLVGETPVKMIKNGQLMIIRGENTYNVLGAQVK